MPIKLKFRTGNLGPNLLGEGISLLNHRNIWRKNSAQSFDIQGPSGYTITWQIQNSRTYAVHDSGVGTNVTQTFTNYTGADGLPLAYDIVVTATRGSLPPRQRRFRRAITILPPLFTEAQANLVLDFSVNGVVTYRMNNLVDRIGYKVFCKGSYSGASWMGLDSFYSSNPELPVHFLADPVNGCSITQTGSNHCMKVVEGKNVLIDGCGNPDGSYGFRFSHTTGGSQTFYVEGSRTTTLLSHPTGRLHVCGLDIDGGNVCAGAGFQHQNATSGNTTYSNWFYDGFTVHDISIKNVLSEGTYLGYNNDHQNTCAMIRNLTMFRVKTDHTGGDGLQFGLCSGEIHDCEVNDAGWVLSPSHQNGVQWNAGNDNLAFYRNKIYNSVQALSMNTGTKYLGNNEVFSNLFSIKRVNAPSVVYIGLMLNTPTPTIDLKMYNNTIVHPNTSSAVSFYIAKAPIPPAAASSVTTEFNKLILANNALVSHTATQYGTLNNPSLANAVISNYITTNINSAGFTNQSTEDYRPSTTSSALFATTNKTFTKTHPLSGEDIDGVPFSEDVFGCYSGYQLRT